jgi:transposase
MDFPGDLGDRALSRNHHLRRFVLEFSGILPTPFWHSSPSILGWTLLGPLSGMWEARHAGKVGVSGESLRRWVRQAEVDAGHRVGMSSVDVEALRELRRENRELRRANEILKAASAFFARELDSRLQRS